MQTSERMRARMTNKEKFKKSLNEDFASDKNYNKIITKIKKGEKMKKSNMWKWSLVPICLVAVIGGIMLNISQNKNIIIDSYIDKENSIELSINNLEKVGASKFDADIKEIQTTNSDASWLNILKTNITIPEDLNKFDSYSIYTRTDKTGEYNILNCNVYWYSSDNNDKDIRISFSDTNKPIRDYLFSDEGSKETTINNTKLKIFKYNTIYFTEFKYEGYNFDIETNNISEEELSNLLFSIIK